MFRYIEKFILQRNIPKSAEELYVNLVELFQSYFDDGLLNPKLPSKRFEFDKTEITKIVVDNRWYVEIIPESLINGYHYFINSFPLVKEIYCVDDKMYITTDFSVSKIRVYNTDVLINITNTIKMTYTARTIPVKELKTLSVPNDLTNYVRTSVLADYATIEVVDFKLEANVKSEEEKIAALGVKIGQDLIAAEGAEQLINEAIRVTISENAELLDERYTELNGKLVTLDSSFKAVEVDLTAIGSTLDNTVDTVVRIQDHLAV